MRTVRAEILVLNLEDDEGFDLEISARLASIEGCEANIIDIQCLKVDEDNYGFFMITYEKFEKHYDETTIDVNVRVVNILKDNNKGLNCEQICEKLSISRDYFYMIIKELLANKIVERTSNIRPIVYKLKV